MQEVLTGLIRM